MQRGETELLGFRSCREKWASCFTLTQDFGCRASSPSNYTSRRQDLGHAMTLCCTHNPSLSPRDSQHPSPNQYPNAHARTSRACLGVVKRCAFPSPWLNGLFDKGQNGYDISSMSDKAHQTMYMKSSFPLQHCFVRRIRAMQGREPTRKLTSCCKVAGRLQNPRTLPVGSYPTPFLGYLLFYITV